MRFLRALFPKRTTPLTRNSEQSLSDFTELDSDALFQVNNICFKSEIHAFLNIVESAISDGGQKIIEKNSFRINQEQCNTIYEDLVTSYHFFLQYVAF